MNDTRILHIEQAIEAALEVVDEIYCEGVSDVHDRIALTRIERLLSAAHQSTVALYRPLQLVKGE